jgi:XTP/dITP diphosphohydrolase
MTGLEVEALNGAPGVFSARYAGEQRSAADNMDKLLQVLSNQSNRNAQFKTVVTQS